MSRRSERPDQLRYDWSRIEDVTATMPGAWTHSARDRTDPIYWPEDEPAKATRDD